jgi:DNA mismatch repair protein MutL
LSSRIVLLSKDIANQIAAGEVVERPASIVKELVENSIDAEATDIRVELKKGGCQSIKVVDNGLGIEKEDVPLVFERHATSKIHKFEDIYRVSSFGFRGEAMPSIASIARVELLTKRKEDVAGTKALVDAGTIKEILPAGCPAGTQIFVNNIFANIPARKKFLKKETTEQSLCLEAINRVALAHPHIRFTVFVDGREVFAAPVANNLAERIAAVMGMDFSATSLPIQSKKDQINLTGFISHPEFTKSNSKNIFLFVNKRFVRDNSLTHAVLSAYRQVIQPRRYPAVLLYIDLSPEDVDVNVHPAKLEVRFKDSRGIYELIVNTIAQNLADAKNPKDSFIYRLTPREKTITYDTPQRKTGFQEKYDGLFARNKLRISIADDLQNKFSAQKIADSEKDTDTTLGEKIFSDFRYLGQFASTYIIFEDKNNLVLLDQHAAHERIILERLKKTAEQKPVSQQLLIPEIISMPAGQISLFSDYIDFLKQIGLEVEIFGRDAIAVKALPALLSHSQAREVISDIADKLSEQSPSSSLQEKKEKIFAALACRAAIKANHILSLEEVEALCRDLENTPFNHTCPHGRPIFIRVSLSEIERMFKRK